MRPDPPTPRARRAGLIAVVAAALALTACSGARPSTSGSEVVDSTLPAAAAPSAPAVAPAVAAPVTTVAPATTIAPSGDVELDKLDADLSAFEHENSGLDQAAAATQEK